MTQAYGRGLAAYDDEGALLEAWFHGLAVGPSRGAGAAVPLPPSDGLRRVEVRPVDVVIEDLDRPPGSAEDVWLRLHLLSHRLVEPNGLELDGMHGLLALVAWTSLGPVAAAHLDDLRLRCRAAGVQLHVRSLDWFPLLLDYVTPPGVRVADPARVRLGAYLAPGTTVMAEGFVTFNAGTLGPCMIEGRVSAGVVVGAGTDVGGGASIMGTLSGGGRQRVRIGERCLLGANSGVGISLGDDCVVEAGCYLTAGSKVTLPDGSVVRARELSGQPRLQYWRNSVSGVLEARAATGRWHGLNQALHVSP